MKKDPVDVLIIGAGAAGAAVAWSLSSSNLKILCLEQGSYHKPSSYSHKNIFLEKLKGNIFNSNPNIRKLKNDYPINDQNSPISIANFNLISIFR